MSTRHLSISITFLQPTCHARFGKEDVAPNEWPPSPLRLFQAMIAGAAARWTGDGDSTRATLTAAAPIAALRWLEMLSESAPPAILAPKYTMGASVPRYVPNNSADLVAAKWARGDSLATFEDRTRKVFRPTYMHGGTTIHYLWPLDASAAPEAVTHITTITAAARCIVALGWGIDVAIGDARLINGDEAGCLESENIERWSPSTSPTTHPALRLPCRGTLDDLIQRHTAFLRRLEGGVFRPTPPVCVFRHVTYRRGVTLPSRPFAVFALRQVDNPDRVRAFRFENTAKVAAMLRHAACEASKQDWPFPNYHSARYVAGHGDKNHRRSVTDDHPRFSYLPLPNVTGHHADGMIRRVLIAEPFGGDGFHAEWAARVLNGKPLIDGDTQQPVAVLERIDNWRTDAAHKTVVPAFINGWRDGGCRTWITASPVVLPGYDGLDLKKAAKLFCRACEQAGLPPGCVEDFEFTGPPRASGSGRIFLPKYMRGLPLRWAVIRFKSEASGPIAIGAGRHCGLGIFVTDQ
jgi:CRISPR-associated protein Csb2